MALGPSGTWWVLVGHVVFYAFAGGCLNTIHLSLAWAVVFVLPGMTPLAPNVINFRYYSDRLSIPSGCQL